MCKEIDRELLDETIENACECGEECTCEEEMDFEAIMEALAKNIEVDTEDVQGLSLNVGEFQAGMDSVSFACGQIAALLSVGLNKDQAIDFVMNRENIDHNQELQSKINENQVEIAKVQSKASLVAAEKTSI